MGAQCTSVDRVFKELKLLSFEVGVGELELKSDTKNYAFFTESHSFQILIH